MISILPEPLSLDKTVQTDEAETLNCHLALVSYMTLRQAQALSAAWLMQSTLMKVN